VGILFGHVVRACWWAAWGQGAATSLPQANDKNCWLVFILRHAYFTAIWLSAALVTPFKNGQIDKDAFCKLVDWQIENGTAALIPVGTTGESPTLSHEEHDLVVELCIKQAAGRVPVIAGAGSNSTAEAVRLAKHGAAAGADAVLIVSPYYNKPTQEGLYQHFSAVAKAVSVSVIVYDIPGRSIVKVDDATMARLAADHANITGIKDATADVGRPTRLRNLLGADFAQLSGEDATAINERLMPLHDSMFCEASPGPVKYAAELLGICSAETRLPLCEIAPASKARVEAALRSAGLLN